MEVIVVFEICNDYILGIYSSELNAINAIFTDTQNCVDEDPDCSWESIYPSKVRTDFRMFKIKIDMNINICIMDLNEIESEIITGTYRELFVRKRELRFNKILN